MANRVDVTSRRPPGVAAEGAARRGVARGEQTIAPPWRRKHRQGRALAIQAPVANIYRAPDSASEVVTQALLAAPATVYPTPDAPDGWARVRLADYAGWTTTAALGLPATTMRVARLASRVAVVTMPFAAIYADATGDARLASSAAMTGGSALAFPVTDGPLAAYATTTLPLLAENADRAQVALPGKLVGWLDRDAIHIRPTAAPRPYLGPAAAITLAQGLLGVPYLWGGVSAQGLDCSGLTQLCCRHAGVVIPRDADQQYVAISYVVARGEVAPGDLLFFGEGGRITHVGLALDNTHMLHANGYHERVTVDALDPADPAFTDYSARLLAMYLGARRPLLADGPARMSVTPLRGAHVARDDDGARHAR